MIVKCECGRDFNNVGGRYNHFHYDKCRQCRLAEYQRNYMRAYRRKNPDMERKREIRRRAADPTRHEKEKARGRGYWNKLRHEAIMAYGGYVCVCCGETEPKVLSMDHMFNDGAAHRKKIGNRGAGLFKWLKDHNYPY